MKPILLLSFLAALLLAIIVVERDEFVKVIPHTEPVTNFQTPWQDESQYVIEQVAADLAEMGYYLKNHRALQGESFPAVANEVLPAGAVPGPDPHQNPTFLYRITVKLGAAGDVTVELPLKSGVWLPSNYRPLTEAIFAKLGLPSGSAESSDLSTVLATLCDQHDAVLATTDKELSYQLKAHFDSAAAHERAALLLEAFALKEATGLFHQIRFELCRATAHLAFADQLRQKPADSDEGHIAAAALAALYENQLRALELLNFKSERPETQAWQQALRMRITGDFRPYEDQSKGTLLERLEWFRARCDRVDADETRNILNLPPAWTDLPDWTRTLAASGPGVSTGHILLKTALPAEENVWSVVYPIETGQAWDEGQVVPALNSAPTRCVDRDGVRVLGWGLWAAALQRELCHVVTQNYDFLERMWGVHDQATEFRQGVEKVFGGLTLYPFVRRLNAKEEKDYRQAQQDAMNLLHRSPHLIPANVWNYLCYVVDYCALWIPPPGHPSINEWHRQNPLPGTVYDIAPRMNHPSLVSQPDSKARLTELHRIAPYNEITAQNLLESFGPKPVRSADFLKTYAAFIDYTPGLAAKYADFPDLPEAVRTDYLGRSAEYLAYSYKVLADILVREGKEAEAAANYEKWIDRAPDQVAVANSSRWLVQYYERHNQTQRATELADAAAEVYSYRGLETKALLLESRGNYDEALVVWKQIDERYASKVGLLGWSLRAYEKTGKAEIARIRDDLLKELAPEGLKLLTPDDLSQPPRVGVLVTTNPRLVTETGLKKNDVIVGMRGYRVMNFKHYDLIREIEPERSSVIKVWRDGKYLDLPPVAPGYRFGVQLSDYPH